LAYAFENLSAGRLESGARWGTVSRRRDSSPPRPARQAPPPGEQRLSAAHSHRRRAEPLHKASATIPLPPFDPDEPDKGLRRLAAKAKRVRPAPWLANSASLVQGPIIFVRDNNMTGVCLTLDGLLKLGWRPIIMGFAKRVEAALGSNLAPADLEKLSPAVRRLLTELRQRP
jgi:hypothetical protein